LLFALAQNVSLSDKNLEHIKTPNHPAMNTYFQKVVGMEVKDQLGKLPDVLVAAVGGGSNAMGLFHDFLDDEVRMVAVEAGGKGVVRIGDHAARFQGGSVGVVEGFKSYFLQDEEGQIQETSSVSAGLDYSGVGPQIAYLVDSGRLEVTYAKDDEVLEAFEILAQQEGIFAAMESSHALVEALKIADEMNPEQVVVFNCSGRGDKDLFITAKYFDKEGFNNYLTEYIHE
jgi:tryptophan synthase beta chain